MNYGSREHKEVRKKQNK